MSDLSFLYAPNGQAYAAGQQIQQDQLKNTGMDLSNQQAAAQLPGIQGVAQQQQVAGQNAIAGQQDTQDFNHQDFLNKMDSSQLQQIQSFGQKAGQLGAIIDQVPAPLRMQALPALAQKFGMDLSNPMISNVLQQAGPDNIGNTLTQMGQGIATSSASAINERAKQQSINQTALQGHQIAAAGTVDAAKERVSNQIQLEQMKMQSALQVAQEQTKRAQQVADTKSKTMLSLMKPDQKWVALNSIPPADRSPDEQSEFERLTQQGYNLKTLGNPALAPQIIQGREVTTPMQQANSAATSLTQRSTAPASNTITPATIKAAGFDYEPDKYNYRINPSTGTVQRAPKG